MPQYVRSNKFHDPNRAVVRQAWVVAPDEFHDYLSHFVDLVGEDGDTLECRNGYGFVFRVPAEMETPTDQ